MRKLTMILTLTMLAMLAFAGTALASHDARGTMSEYKAGDVGETYGKMGLSVGCLNCHGGIQDYASSDINIDSSSARNLSGGGFGPHGGYMTGTSQCATCHTVHSNPKYAAADKKVGKSAQLLPANNVTDVCRFCHNLTGSERAPYNVSNIDDPQSIQSAHRVAGEVYFEYDANDAGLVQMDKTVKFNNAVTTIPGGATDGNQLTIDDQFDANQGKLSGLEFTCDSCHSPHGVSSKVVAPYLGEQNLTFSSKYATMTTRLLKRNMADGGTEATVYGSAWCANCHQGRLGMASGNYNHPVNKTGLGYDWKTVSGTPFGAAADGTDMVATGVYANRKPTIKMVGLTADATLTRYGAAALPIAQGFNGDPRSNKWYAMADTNYMTGDAFADGNLDIADYTFLGDADKNGPSCQQCHASARDVAESFSGDGAPEFTAFPHLSANKYLLVEGGDDLCTNCHDASVLP